jgi:hypothetical protein
MRTAEPIAAEAARRSPLPDARKFGQPGAALTTPRRLPLADNPQTNDDSVEKFPTGGADQEGVTTIAPDTVADKLCAWWSPFPGRLQKLTGNSRPHRLLHLRDEQSSAKTYRVLRRYPRCETSSAAAFDVLRRLSFRPHEKVLFINMGTFLGDNRRLAVF